MGRVHPIEFTGVHVVRGTSNDAGGRDGHPPASGGTAHRSDGIDSIVVGLTTGLVTTSAGLEIGGAISQTSSSFPDECAAEAPSTPKPTHLRRQVTQKQREHYDALPASYQALAQTFRSAPAPAPGGAVMLASIFGACVILQLVAAVYAFNERGINSRALHGFVAGVLAAFIVGFVFLVTAPTRVMGEFHARYFLSFPITIAIGIGVGFIRTADTHLGLLATIVIAIAIGYVACIVCTSNSTEASDRPFWPSASYFSSGVHCTSKSAGSHPIFSWACCFLSEPGSRGLRRCSS